MKTDWTIVKITIVYFSIFNFLYLNTINTTIDSDLEYLKREEA